MYDYSVLYMYTVLGEANYQTDIWNSSHVEDFLYQIHKDGSCFPKIIAG